MIHSNDHISSIKANFPDAYEVAIAAVQSVITAVNQVCSGKKKMLFVLFALLVITRLTLEERKGFAISIILRLLQNMYKSIIKLIKL